MLEELQRGDVVEITTSVDPESHKVVQEIHAERPRRVATGKLLARDDELRTIMVEAGDETKLQRLKIIVPKDLEHADRIDNSVERAGDISGKTGHAGQPESGRSLDRPVRPSGARNVANNLEAQRRVEFQGVLAEDCNGKRLSVIKEGKVVKLAFGIHV